MFRTWSADCSSTVHLSVQYVSHYCIWFHREGQTTINSWGVKFLWFAQILFSLWNFSRKKKHLYLHANLHMWPYSQAIQLISDCSGRRRPTITVIPTCCTSPLSPPPNLKWGLVYHTCAKFAQKLWLAPCPCCLDKRGILTCTWKLGGQGGILTGGCVM